jgi:hypothetical protein
MATQPRHIYNLRRSLPDPRDHVLMAAPAALPDSDALGVAVPVKNQAPQGSCTGNGDSSMREALALLHGEPYLALSRAYIYARERMAEGALDRDAGAAPRDGMEVMLHFGVPPETDMPYDYRVFNVAPSAQADADAAAHVITGYAQVIGSYGVRYATTLHRPTGIALAVYESFEEVGKDGLIPIPDPNNEQMRGGHWVFGNADGVRYRGYQKDSSVPGGGFLVVQNSWDVTWGDGGFGYLPYAMLDNPHFVMECWSIY